VFSIAWSPDDALTFAASGISANHDVRETLGVEPTEAGNTFKEKTGTDTVGVTDDDEGGSYDDERSNCCVPLRLVLRRLGVSKG
jgi:hypothetical protein